MKRFGGKVLPLLFISNEFRFKDTDILETKKRSVVNLKNTDFIRSIYNTIDYPHKTLQ